MTAVDISTVSPARMRELARLALLHCANVKLMDLSRREEELSERMGDRYWLAYDRLEGFAFMKAGI